MSRGAHMIVPTLYLLDLWPRLLFFGSLLPPLCLPLCYEPKGHNPLDTELLLSPFSSSINEWLHSPLHLLYKLSTTGLYRAVAGL